MKVYEQDIIENYKTLAKQIRSTFENLDTQSNLRIEVDKLMNAEVSINTCSSEISCFILDDAS